MTTQAGTDTSGLASDLRVDVVRDLAAFSDLERGWDLLVAGSPRPSPFLLHAWLAAWWAEQGAGREFHVVAVFRADALVGAFPLEIVSRGRVRVGRVPGPAMALGDVIARPDDPVAVCTAVAAAVRSLPLDVVDIEGVAAESLLITVLGDRGLLRSAPGMVAPTLEMPAGFEAARRAATSSKTRNTQDRRFRQLAGTGDASWALHVTPDAIAAALPDAYRLHDLRWEGHRDAVGYDDRSAFGRTALRPFHLRALTGIAGAGHARLLELRLDGVPIAFDLYFLVGGTMVVYRLAFDPAFARFSPGLLTTLEALRRASEEGATRVEFLRGAATRWSWPIARTLSAGSPDSLGRRVVGCSRPARSRRRDCAHACGRATGCGRWCVAPARRQLASGGAARRPDAPGSAAGRRGVAGSGAYRRPRWEAD